MSKCVLIKVIDREIYTEQFDSVEEAWSVVVQEFNEFINENGIYPDYDCQLNENWLSAWANGVFTCIDWTIHVIE